MLPLGGTHRRVGGAAGHDDLSPGGRFGAAPAVPPVKHREMVLKRRRLVIAAILAVFLGIVFLLALRRKRPAHFLHLAKATVDVVVHVPQADWGQLREEQVQGVCTSEGTLAHRIHYITDDDAYVCEKVKEFAQRPRPALVNCSFLTHCSSSKQAFGRRVFDALNRVVSFYDEPYVLILSIHHDPASPRFLKRLIEDFDEEKNTAAVACTTVAPPFLPPENLLATASAAAPDPKNSKGGKPPTTTAVVPHDEDATHRRRPPAATDDANTPLVVVDRGFSITYGESHGFDAVHFARRLMELPAHHRRASTRDLIDALNGECLFTDLTTIVEYAPRAQTSKAKRVDTCRSMLPVAVAWARAFLESTNVSEWQLTTWNGPLFRQDATMAGRRFTYLYDLAQKRWVDVFGSAEPIPEAQFPRHYFLPQNYEDLVSASIVVSAELSKALQGCAALSSISELTWFGWELSTLVRADGRDLVASTSVARLVLPPETALTHAGGDDAPEPPVQTNVDRLLWWTRTTKISPPAARRDYFGLTFASHAVDTASSLPAFDLSMQKSHFRSPTLHVVWDGYCCLCCGFATEIMSMIIALSERLKVHTTMHQECFCQGYPLADRDALRRYFISAPAYAGIPAQDVVVWISHRPPDTFLVNPLFQFRTPDYFIGRSMYEFTRLPNWWKPKFDLTNEIWTPSRWVSKVFADNGCSAGKLVNVPEPVDADEFDPDLVGKLRLPDDLRGMMHMCSRPYASLAKARFRFVSHFKWEPRKGWNLLLDAYLSAFSGREDVALYILTNLWYPNPSKNPYNVSEAFGLAKDHYARAGVLLDGAPPFCVITESMEQKDMIRFYNSADAFVLPTRGEGWGLPLIQAMALAKPTIATGWGGQLAFMTSDNAFLIDLDAEEEVPAEDNPYTFEEAKRWATPSVEHLTDLMAYVSSHPAHAKEVGRRARAHVQSHFSGEAVADVLVNRLKIVYDFVLRERRRG